MSLRKSQRNESFSANIISALADGSSFPIEYSGTPLRQDGKLVVAVVTFQDITERRRAEETLRKTEENLRTLLVIRSL